jgi:hypothetical protein
MAFFAWTQDLPIDRSAYDDITARMGDSPMPGLVVHVAVEKADGKMHYLDVWESKEAHDAAFASVVHPAVHHVLMERQIHIEGEPPRSDIKVVEVRFADGTAIRA